MDDLAARVAEVLLEFAVVVQPPHRGLRDQEKLRAAGSLSLQLGDRFRAVRRMVSGIHTARELRKVFTRAAVEAQQLVISLRDHQYLGPSGKGSPGYLTNSRDRGAVLRRLATVVVTPEQTPFVLEALAVRLEERCVHTCREQRAERSLSKMVNKHILGVGDPVAGSLD